MNSGTNRAFGRVTAVYIQPSMLSLQVAIRNKKCPVTGYVGRMLWRMHY